MMAGWGVVAVLAVSCQSPGRRHAVHGGVEGVRARLEALHGKPDEAVRGEVSREAALLAERGTREAVVLKERFRVMTPAWMHNCFVNVGFRERGLCWQYMEDLFRALDALDLRCFDLHCGVRNSGSLLFEHHCVVVTAADRPFRSGLVFDPWEAPGRLLVFPVEGHPRRWEEDRAFRAYLRSGLRVERSGGGGRGDR